MRRCGLAGPRLELMTGSRPAVGRVGFGDAVCESGRVLRAEALERSRREFERRSRRGRRSAARGTGIGDLNPAQAPEYVGQTQVVVRPEVRRMKVAEARGLERSNRFDRLPLRRLVVLRGSPAARVEREHVWRQTVSFDPEPAGLRAVGRPPSGRSCSDPAMLAKIRASKPQTGAPIACLRVHAALRAFDEPSSRGAGPVSWPPPVSACSSVVASDRGGDEDPPTDSGTDTPYVEKPRNATHSESETSLLPSIQRAIYTAGNPARAYRVTFAVTEKHGRLVRISRSPANPQRTVTRSPIPESPAPVGPVEML